MNIKKWRILAFIMTLALARFNAGSACASGESVGNFVSCLKEKAVDPVEYFVNLFDSHKIVVFTEANHYEMTQYEFLAKVVNHPKFTEKVRAVFTEVGSRSQQSKMDEFLNSNVMQDKYLIEINQANVVHPCGWPNPNCFGLWKEIWNANHNAPAEKKVHAYLSDIEWDWKKMQTRLDYKNAIIKMAKADRDRQMAKLITDKINSIDAGISNDKNKKAGYLVIMNTRHGIGRAVSAKKGGKPASTVAYWLKDSFGDAKVFNVLYHQRVAYAGGTDENAFALIDSGKWDAAFHINENKPAGFDLKGTPFGASPFDFMSGIDAPDYSHAFDGLVFWKPLKDYYRMNWYPGFYNEPAWRKEVDRRCKITGVQPNPIQKIIDKFSLIGAAILLSTAKDGMGYSEDDIMAIIKKWL